MKDKKHQQKEVVQKQPRWLKDLGKRTKKTWGKRCEEFCYGCCVCMAYLALDILDDLYGYEYEKK